jgi:hypothetical protein
MSSWWRGLCDSGLGFTSQGGGRCWAHSPCLLCAQRQTHAPQGPSFNNVIGAGEQRRRHGETERLRSLEIDDEVKLGRLLDRNVGRLGAS